MGGPDLFSAGVDTGFAAPCLDNPETVADTLSVRKVKKNEAAAAMARLRWKGVTAAERKAQSMKAAEAAAVVHRAKAAARRAERAHAASPHLCVHGRLCEDPPSMRCGPGCAGYDEARAAHPETVGA